MLLQGDRVVKAVFVIVVILLLVGAGMFRADIPLDELKSVYARGPSRFIDIGELEIHYRDQGPQNTAPLVLLHGAFSSLHTWEAWVEQLSRDRRVITLDLPGFGLTGPDPSGDYSVDRTVDLLHLFLREIGVLCELGVGENSVHIGGNSLGGQVAWNYALAFPEHTASLVLVDSSGYREFSTPPPVIFRYAQWVANINTLCGYTKYFRM